MNAGEKCMNVGFGAMNAGLKLVLAMNIFLLPGSQPIPAVKKRSLLRPFLFIALYKKRYVQLFRV